MDKLLAKTLRGVIRRMRFAAPDVLRVGAKGVAPEILQLAAEAEGISLDPKEPEGWIVWSPENDPGTCVPPGSSAIAAAVIAPAISAPPLPHIAAESPARKTSTLREWVGGWPLGKWISPFLASDAVGARTCSIPIHGAKETLFVKTPQNAAGSPRAGNVEELAVTVFGLGYFPIMPATLVCMAMVPPALAAHFLLGPGAFCGLAFVVAAAASVASVALERWAGARFLAEDPREFVLDEVAGLAFTWALLPPSAPWWGILAGFFLFRVFDIFKWGVSWIEKLPVRGRIVWDDLLAGLYAGICAIGFCHILGK